MEVASAVCPRSNRSSYPVGANSAAETPGASNVSAASRLQSASRMPLSLKSSQKQTPSTPNKHVNFGGNGGTEEKKREKFLTAKYGAHQMALIRKRLRVEMWMYERLQELYGADDIEIDLDEVLDLDDEKDRRAYINDLLKPDGTNGPCVTSDAIEVFVGDLLQKVKTL